MLSQERGSPRGPSVGDVAKRRRNVGFVCRLRQLDHRRDCESRIAPCERKRIFPWRDVAVGEKLNRCNIERPAIFSLLSVFFEVYERPIIASAFQKNERERFVFRPCFRTRRRAPSVSVILSTLCLCPLSLFPLLSSFLQASDIVLALSFLMRIFRCVANDRESCTSAHDALSLSRNSKDSLKR